MVQVPNAYVTCVSVVLILKYEKIVPVLRRLRSVCGRLWTNTQLTTRWRRKIKSRTAVNFILSLLLWSWTTKRPQKMMLITVYCSNHLNTLFTQPMLVLGVETD